MTSRWMIRHGLSVSQRSAKRVALLIHTAEDGTLSIEMEKVS